MDGLTISQVASAAQVHIETVRYYERRGLIAKPPRNHSGYRIYSDEAVEDIQFIKRAQEIGFTLEEIRELLTMRKQEDYFPTDELYQLSLAKVQDIDRKIIQFQQFKALLELVTKRSPSMPPFSKSQCPILKKCAEGESEYGCKD